MNGKCFIVGGGIPVMFASFEPDEEGSENLVVDGDEDAFESAELSSLDTCAAIGFLDHRPMTVESDDAFVQCCSFHATFCRFTLEVGRWRGLGLKCA
ncbi:MAG TPA: hypothetical protein PK318_09265 [Accumulibacter sp.]|nr:hypothetical protein [Accumulibacter sp.]HNE13546.1 hypothetical protein [Accumulibacter sp.]